MLTDAMAVHILRTARGQNVRLSNVTDLQHSPPLCHWHRAVELANRGLARVELMKRPKRHGDTSHRWLVITAKGRDFIDAIDSPRKPARHVARLSPIVAPTMTPDTKAVQTMTTTTTAPLSLRNGVPTDDVLDTMKTYELDNLRATIYRQGMPYSMRPLMGAGRTALLKQLRGWRDTAQTTTAPRPAPRPTTPPVPAPAKPAPTVAPAPAVKPAPTAPSKPAPTAPRQGQTAPASSAAPVRPVTRQEKLSVVCLALDTVRQAIAHLGALSEDDRTVLDTALTAVLETMEAATTTAPPAVSAPVATVVQCCICASSVPCPTFPAPRDVVCAHCSHDDTADDTTGDDTTADDAAPAVAPAPALTQGQCCICAAPVSHDGPPGTDVVCAHCGGDDDTAGQGEGTADDDDAAPDCDVVVMVKAALAEGTLAALRGACQAAGLPNDPKRCDYSSGGSMRKALTAWLAD